MYLPLAMYMTLVKYTPSSGCLHAFFGVLAVLDLGVFAPLILVLRGTVVVAIRPRSDCLIVNVVVVASQSISLLASCAFAIFDVVYQHHLLLLQFCALIRINCRCHCCSLLRLDVGHDYCVNDIVVQQLLLASLIQHKKCSPNCCRWGRLRLQGCLVWGACFLNALMPHNDGLNHIHCDWWWRCCSLSCLCLAPTLARSQLGFR